MVFRKALAYGKRMAKRKSTYKKVGKAASKTRKAASKAYKSVKGFSLRRKLKNMAKKQKKKK